MQVLLQSGDLRRMDEYISAYWRRHKVALGRGGGGPKAIDEQTGSGLATRDLIKASASIFIVLGAAGFFVSALGAIMFLLQGSSAGITLALLVALFGIVSAAGTVLTGGACYLLASIDERIQRLTERP